MIEKTENSKTDLYEVKDSDSSQCSTNGSMDAAILSELASIGAGHAATSLSEVLQHEVRIDVPRIHNVPAHLLLKVFGLHEMPSTALYVQLASGVECDILLILEAEEAKKVAAMMTMSTSVGELDPAMEESALEELANILVGSFLSAISDFVATQLVSSPPARIVDAFDAVLDSLLAKNSMLYKETMLFDISFRASAQISKCMLLLFPSPDLQRLLVEKSKVMACVDAPSQSAVLNVGAT